MLALIVVLAVTYKYVESEGCDAIMASILSLSAFLILLPPTIVSKGGETVADIIPKAWAGFLLNGWQGAVVQLATIVMSTIVYYPFVRMQDKAMLKEEQAADAEHNSDNDAEEEGIPQAQS